MPHDVVGIIASFARLSVLIKLVRFDVRFAAVCKLQRMWRTYRATSRFVIGGFVCLVARHYDDPDSKMMIVQLIARRREDHNEIWKSRLLCSRFRHYIYIRRISDPNYIVKSCEHLAHEAWACISTTPL